MKYTSEEINENRQKWLDQLRNPEAGKHQRQIEDVANPSKRHVMGHACHVLGAERDTYEDKFVTYKDAEDMQFYNGLGRSMTSAGILPYTVAEKLNITRHGRFNIELYRDRTFFRNLTLINDKSEMTLHEMADIIEKQFANDNFAPFSDIYNPKKFIKEVD